MTRGLSYRNDGPELAEAKKNAFKRMLMKYPPDVARECCERLRPRGWFPSVDEVELEIIEALEWRKEAFAALENGEVLTADQLNQIKHKKLGYQLEAALEPFPIWDRGKPQHKENHAKAVAKLTEALKNYTEFVPDVKRDFVDRRSVSLAQGFIDAGFLPNPNRRENEEDRQQRMKLEAENMDRIKAEKIADLHASVDDDMIAELEGQKHI